MYSLLFFLLSECQFFHPNPKRMVINEKVSRLIFTSQLKVGYSEKKSIFVSGCISVNY